MRSRNRALALVAAGPKLQGVAAAITGLILPATVPAAHAQPGGDGIDWVTIGAVNNPAYDGDDPFNRVRGRGGVSYEYRIGRFEVTSAQWAEFLAAALDRADPIPWVERPLQTYGGGNPMAPTGGVTWRTCAVFCNWLHNNKSPDRAAFLNGAYDVGTFGEVSNFFTDQWEHNPGARYWIPTLDEHLKAAHYDSNRLNPDGTRGGWWQYNITSDVAPIYGPPPGFPNGNATNQANSGFSIFPGRQEFDIPLGAYANVTSPWGLYDTAGGTSEWIEEVVDGPVTRARYSRGSGWASQSVDVITAFGGGFPSQAPFHTGFRLASAVPSVGSLGAFACGGVLALRPARRRGRSRTS